MKKVVFGDEAWGMCHRQWEDLWTPLAGGGSGDRIKPFEFPTRNSEIPTSEYNWNAASVHSPTLCVQTQGPSHHCSAGQKLRPGLSTPHVCGFAPTSSCKCLCLSLLPLVAPMDTPQLFLVPWSEYTLPLIHSEGFQFGGLPVVGEPLYFPDWVIKFLDAGGCTTQHFPTVVVLRLF